MVTETIQAQAKPIIDNLAKLTSFGGSEKSIWVNPYRPFTEPVHQFVVFVKPEATASGVNMEGLLDLVFKASETWKIKFGAVRLLSGAYLRENRVMDEHYGVINAISRNGRQAISAKAETALKENFAKELEAGAEVLGGHQFLERYKQFSALALSVLSDNMGVKKLAGGTYALAVKVLGKNYILLNAFHPYQLEAFTADDKTIIVLEGRSEISWADLRQKYTGATNPNAAEAGSIRNQLLQAYKKLGIAEISQGLNGIHVSAGPLEGMAELVRFFSEPGAKKIEASATAFGAELGASSLSGESICALAANPTLEVDGNKISAFDLTEEKDGKDAARLLAQAK